MTGAEFQQQLNELAQAWQEKNYQRAVSFFAEQIVYADPTRYAMNGKPELLKFFEEDEGYPQHTTWHNVVFDEARQVGAVEYTYIGTYQYHGVVLIKLQDGLITHWREYQHVSDQDHRQFVGRTFFQ
jgi:hypothetical protein